MPKAKSKQVEEIPVELEPDILERIDALKAHFSTEDHQATRDDVLRALTIHGLKAKEREAKKQKGERTTRAASRKVNQ